MKNSIITCIDNFWEILFITGFNIIFKPTFCNKILKLSWVMFAISVLHHDFPNTGIVSPTQAASPAPGHRSAILYWFLWNCQQKLIFWMKKLSTPHVFKGFLNKLIKNLQKWLKRKTPNSIWIIWHHVGLKSPGIISSGIFWDHLVWEHLVSSCFTWDHLASSAIISPWIIWDHPGIIWDHLGPSGIICDHLG